MCSLPDELCDCSISEEDNNYFSDIENEVIDIDINKNNKCCYCIKCPYPDYMLDTINFDEKIYKVCDANKISLYNKLVNEKNNSNNYKVKTYISGTNEFIHDDIFNIEENIFRYEIITDFYMLNKMKECIKLDKNNGLNSNQYYLKFICSLPWTKDLDKILDNYTNCSELLENHFRKKPDRPNITFGDVPIKYNKYYYNYVFWATDCVECQKKEEKKCPIYNKIYNFLEKKSKK